jgi:hypothetical protein
VSLSSLPLFASLLPVSGVLPEAAQSIGADMRWLRNAARDPLALQSHCLCSAESLLGPD